MPIDSAEVHRLSIRNSPVSNTELNFERLPEPESIAGMELRYRAEPSSSRVFKKHPFACLASLWSAGTAYAWVFQSSPSVFESLWAQAEQIEGMTIVGGMLVGLALMIGGLSLVFVPKEIRRGLAALSMPIAASVYMVAKGHTIVNELLGFAGSALAALMCHRLAINFHKSWLSADPRCTSAQLSAQKAVSGGGWTFPAVDEVTLFSQRFFAFSDTAIPGVWLAPSSRSLRAVVPCLFAGGALGMTSSITANLSVWLAIFCSLALGMLPLFVVVFWIAGSVSWLTKKNEQLVKADERSPFERCSDRVRQSEHESTDVVTGAPVLEAEHLFFGFEPHKRFPILLHKTLLHEHVYISGRTGSGKTSMGLMQLLIQLLRGHRITNGQWSEKTPMVIIDLKGDPVLFQTAKAESEARGQKFRFFTVEPGKSSFHFNPFIAFKSGALTLPQLIQSILDACGLYYGDEYGKRYYSERHRNLLSQALRVPEGVENFRQLYRRLNALYTERPQEFKDGFELLSVIESMTHYEQLITSSDQEASGETIRMEQVLEERQVVYFWLPSAKESVVANQIGKFVLFSLRAAAHDRAALGKEKRQAFLLVDEFQRLAGDNFNQIMQQARSAGIAVILANQALADLKSATWDLMPTIQTNTRAKMYFSITSAEDIQTFRDLSGEEIQTFGLNDVEEIRLRFRTQELAALSDHPKRLLLHVTSGSGYTQFGGLPIPVETDWPISKELSDERAAMPWPVSPIVFRSLDSHFVTAPVESSSTKSAKKKKTPKVGRISPPPDPAQKQIYSERARSLWED